jgi:hypothetical protein
MNFVEISRQWEEWQSAGKETPKILGFLSDLYN